MHLRLIEQARGRRICLISKCSRISGSLRRVLEVAQSRLANWRKHGMSHIQEASIWHTHLAELCHVETVADHLLLLLLLHLWSHLM